MADMTEATRFSTAMRLIGHSIGMLEGILLSNCVDNDLRAAIFGAVEMLRVESDKLIRDDLPIHRSRRHKE